jgi:thymidine phosphorylase
VEIIDLITASILSKKLAAGLEALVLDVKSARAPSCAAWARREALARGAGHGARGGLPDAALITDMDQPLATARAMRWR